jgi:transcriptional regulator with XRE-family HTH domain
VVADCVDMQAMGERVLLLRRRANLSQNELARQAGVDVMTISRLERGTKKRLEVEPLVRLAKALHVTTDHLLCLEAAAQRPANSQSLGGQGSGLPRPTRTRKAASVA